MSSSPDRAASFRSLPAIMLAAIVGLHAAPDARAQLAQVIPPAYAAAEAASSSTTPWNAVNAPVRVQFCYDSTFFAAASLTSPVVVTRLRWRANAAASSTVWTGGTYGRAAVTVSTSAVDYSGVSPMFDQNHGADRTNVHYGALAIAPGAGQGAGTPGPWYVDVPFDTPFVYDPNQGDFLIEVVLDNTTWSGGSSTSCDNEAIAGATPGSRVLSFDSITAATGTVTQHQAPVIEVEYVPANGLFAAFAATPARGASPLVVSFGDRSYSSAPSGVTTWAWDFDNDGVVDSTQQHPTHIYTQCGVHSVRLTVTDGMNPPVALLRSNLIVTDEVLADFTHALLPGSVVQFTDVTAPPATSWAWDLDGDGMTDSTQQNPSWVYANASTFTTVTLQARRLCGPTATARRRVGTSLVLSLPVTTNLGVGGPPPAGGGYYFDVTVTAPTGITLQGMDFSCGGQVNTPITVDLYATDTTYAGKTTTPAAWRRIATGNLTRATGNIQFVQFQQGALLPAGSYGLLLHMIGVFPLTGPAASPFGNADLLITTGAAQTGPVPMTGSVQNNRMPGGAFHYTLLAMDPRATAGFLGTGCAGSLPVSTAVTTALPRLGHTYSLRFDNLPIDAVLIVVGLNHTTSPVGPLPLDLAAFGLPGCLGRVRPDTLQFVVGSMGAVDFQLGLPNNPQLLGSPFFAQAFVPDPFASNPAAAVISDAAAAIVGN